MQHFSNDSSRIANVYSPDCNWVHYPANAMGVVILITSETGIAAILPPDSAEEYPAALPGGHGEYGKSHEAAAIREALRKPGFTLKLHGC